MPARRGCASTMARGTTRRSCSISTGTSWKPRSSEPSRCDFASDRAADVDVEGRVGKAAAIGTAVGGVLPVFERHIGDAERGDVVLLPELRRAAVVAQRIAVEPQDRDRKAAHDLAVDEVAQLHA